MKLVHGYTLVESLTIICILCIILLLANTQLNSLFKKQQANLAYTELQSIVHSARNIAINNRRSLTLCGSSNGVICDNNWSIGAFLFEDANQNGIIDNNDKAIRYVSFNLKNATIHWKGFSGSKLIFESLGITYASNGTFTYCDISKDLTLNRQVIVNRGGRAKKSYDANGDGIHEDSQGNNIFCP